MRRTVVARSDRAATERLSVAFARGEPEAIGSIAVLVGRVVGSRGYYIVPDERPDVIQEAILDLVRAVKTSEFASDDEFRGFVRTITYRRCVDWVRKTRPKIELESELTEWIQPDEGLLFEERRRLAVDIFSKLKQGCRELIALRIGRGMTYAQISRVLGRTEGALRTQSYACLKQARIILDRMRRRRKLRRLVDWRSP